MKLESQALLVAAVAALALTAQDGRKGASEAAILHPEMAVQTGTYDKPAATLGVRPAEPWTATTIEAAVNKTPNAGKPVTVVGEILDLSCYLQLGKHGEAHRACGQKCVRNGQPIGLLARDGTVYVLMPEEHHARRDGGVDAKESASEHMGHIVEVNGTESTVNGTRAIFVQGLTK
ncbi:MAG TPA: hypothetical protein VKF41_12440 [Bryobacteraceae bacterium]|nr:hypothetical protein [Bryobacteraceae bacterium]